MNKTLSINLGGFFFHIDEDAYQKLSRYFDAVKRSLDPEGRDEIIKDIESRIAELFQERLKNDKQVVGLIEVDQVIAIMGQPEDYRIDEDTNQNSSTKSIFSDATGKTKRLYRDRDNAILGGIAAGFGHYFNIDPLWVRILFIISPFVTFGTSVLIYLALWILIPEAVTTSQKLEMQGEPINLSNIEKKVKEGISEITDKINSIDGKEVANTAKRGANQIATTIGDVFLGILKVFAKIIGVFILVIASVSLLGIIISGLIMVFSSSLPENLIFNHIHSPLDMSVPMWFQGLLLILVAGIPLVFFLILGLKLLVSNLRSMGNYTKISLIAVWIVSLAFAGYLAIKQATEKSFDGKTIQTQEMVFQAKDTLFIKMQHNNYYTKSVRERISKQIMQDESKNQVIYSNDVKVYYFKTDKSSPYIEVEKLAVSNSYQSANQIAEEIKYHFEIQENKINLDNYFVTDTKNRYKEQEVRVNIYIPEGTIIFPDKSTEGYLRSSFSGIDIYYGEEGNYYKLVNENFECISCAEIKPGEEEDSINTDNINIKINNKEVKIKVDENNLNIQTK